jgi:hypothetical protein
MVTSTTTMSIPHPILECDYKRKQTKTNRQKLNVYKRIKQIFKFMDDESKENISTNTKSPTRALLRAEAYK